MTTHGNSAQSYQIPKFLRKHTYLTLLLLIALAFAGVSMIRLAANVAIVEVVQNKSTIEPLIDEYMQAMNESDAEHAYALFSTRAQRQMSMADIESLLHDDTFVLFDGYQSAHVDIISTSMTISTYPGSPQGLVARVKGSVFYIGGLQGSFDAVLEMNGEHWRLFNIQVNRPYERPRSVSQAKVTDN